ncbi:MAG: hypothetical protein Q7T82_04575 [Armatimonadota bacterium]|nr:hypothetical protein [Armatimonadota bacterium]
MDMTISVLWDSGALQGLVEARNAELADVGIRGGDGSVSGNSFSFEPSDGCRLNISVSHANLSLAAEPSVISLRTSRGAFSFLLRDVNREYPIFLPQFGAIVTEADDLRSYEQIENAVRLRGGQTTLQRLEGEAEETYENAAANTRNVWCPTWLGLSRDMRIFELGWDRWTHTIRPFFHSQAVRTSPDGPPMQLRYVAGRGVGCGENFTRRLEDGVLPILHGQLIDDDVTYDYTAFAALESSKLTPGNLRGTHYLVADGHAIGHTFTESQEAQYAALLPGEMDRDEEAVLFLRIEAVNTGSAPRYAWFKSVWSDQTPYSFDGAAGFGMLQDGRVFCVSTIDGGPLPKEEIAVLLAPGKTAVLEAFVPHSPISRERAERLAKQDFDRRHSECSDFWKGKLASAATVRLPEKRLEEMTRAGLLHLDLITYGLEPDEPVTPCVGVYCPIGSESAPIVQFMDSIGWNSVARRALRYFLDKQHDDGFMQNYGRYMLETGAVLWSIGEHYRYTRDDQWAAEIAPKLLKSCDYMLRWRERNRKEELRGRGYGMLDGKVADPNDPYHIFMLNGYAYLGLSRTAEMLRSVNPTESERLARAADDLKQDIRDTLFETMARSPVVPLGDGTWCPTAPAWAEADGPVCLLTDAAEGWTPHGTIGIRDSALGPLYLAFQEVVEPDEPAAAWLLNYVTELLHMRNVAFSQPYYSRHPWLNLRLGQVNAFLKAHYNALASLADRETYTFTEHYFFVSNHKTHEEGWFLMQMRWMLYMEQGEDLKLLPGIPRTWMENGKSIELDGMVSYFGPLSLRVESRLDDGYVTASAKVNSDRPPKRIGIRLPHPKGKKASGVEGGRYDAETETIWVEHFGGEAKVRLSF